MTTKFSQGDQFLSCPCPTENERWQDLWALQTIMTAPLPKGPKIIRLPRNGPKPGQSMRAWLYGKEREEKEFQRRLAEQDQDQRK